MESAVTYIENPPENPMDLFKEFILQKPQILITMNLATINKEFGVLNRTVVYRGLYIENDLQENCIFVTEKLSQKYQDIQENPQIAATFFNSTITEINNQSTTIDREVRFNGIAVELTNNEITKLWNQEKIYAKIRSQISECGKPVDWTTIKFKHDHVLNAYHAGDNQLQQTKSYTAFRIIPNMICFYKTLTNQIADRIIYRRTDIQNKNWTFGHVYP